MACADIKAISASCSPGVRLVDALALENGVPRAGKGQRKASLVPLPSNDATVDRRIKNADEDDMGGGALHQRATLVSSWLRLNAFARPSLASSSGAVIRKKIEGLCKATPVSPYDLPSSFPPSSI